MTDYYIFWENLTSFGREFDSFWFLKPFKACLITASLPSIIRSAGKMGNLTSDLSLEFWNSLGCHFGHFWTNLWVFCQFGQLNCSFMLKPWSRLIQEVQCDSVWFLLIQSQEIYIEIAKERRFNLGIDSTWALVIAYLIYLHQSMDFSTVE